MPPTRGRGRPPRTTRQAVERVALDLFARHGFTETTVDDIAAAAGISRRTFFRYYLSKNDVVWGDFDRLLRDLDASLAASDRRTDIVEAIAAGVVRFNELPPEAVPQHRQRMALILYVPALQAHSTLRYAAWRDVIARFTADRLGRAVDDLAPQLMGHLALAAALAAHECWLRDESADLATLLATTFRSLRVDAE